MTAALPILEAREASVVFPGRGGAPVEAVRGASLAVRAGETVGLIGGSGSGKTTLARALIGLQPLAAGAILFDGEPAGAGRPASGFARAVQYVFQDPADALDPRKPCWWSATEALRLIERPGDAALRMQARALFERVRLPAAALDRFPHQLSGGQRQRVALARALAVSPRLLILDEPTSALDVSVQARILNELLDIHAGGVALLLISHDLAVVRHLCRFVAVMTGGRIVEAGPREQVLEAPEHPYTKALLQADRALRFAAPGQGPLLSPSGDEFSIPKVRTRGSES